MAIDPMMYERLSGKKGDPMDRLGAVSAQNDARQHQRDRAAKGVSGGLGWSWGNYWRWRAVMAIGGAVFVLIAILLGWKRW